MSHSVAELYAEPIERPSPVQLKGRMFYIAESVEHLERESALQIIHEEWLRRHTELQARGWRRVLRVVRDKEFRSRRMTVTIPIWLLVVLSGIGFSEERD